jgi:hypothetical protein
MKRSINDVVGGAYRSPRPAGSTTALRAATDPIDDTSPGKLMEGVLVAFAQFDSDALSDRTRTAYRPTSRRTAFARKKSGGSSFDSLRSLRTFDVRWWPAMSEPSARESALKGSRVVSLTFASWDRIREWLRQLGALRAAA